MLTTAACCNSDRLNLTAKLFSISVSLPLKQSCSSDPSGSGPLETHLQMAPPSHSCCNLAAPETVILTGERCLGSGVLMLYAGHEPQNPMHLPSYCTRWQNALVRIFALAHSVWSGVECFGRVLRKLEFGQERQSPFLRHA